MFTASDTLTDKAMSAPALHPVLIDIMNDRGACSADERARYMAPDYERDTHDPFLFDDMRTCVDRVIRAVQGREKICIYGDYDVDGVCATVILYETLAKLGGDVCIRINHRNDEGYGLHIHALDELADNGVSLIITTDQGISNKREIDYAQSRGMDVIITDHHTVPEDPAVIPQCVGIIHPRVHAGRYPFADLSGGGAAFKLAQGLIRTAGTDTNEWKYYERWLLDLVCLSTLADCVPIIGENRAFLHFGLIVLNKMRRAGIRALVSVTPVRPAPITTHTILFYLSPLLNAASRMDHAHRAFEILTAQTREHAKTIADILVLYNKERQKLTARITREARAQCISRAEEHRILVGSSPDWPLGVLGLVAGTLVRSFEKPIVLISEKSNQTIGVARSTAGIHITHTFQKIKPLFERYGGHHRAGGFALKEGVSTTQFIDSINSIVHDDFSAPAVDSPNETIYTLRLCDITVEFASQLHACQPWGAGNTEPLFSIAQCTVKKISRVGKKMQHLRLDVAQGAESRVMLGIKKGGQDEELAIGDTLTILCTIDIGVWQGRQDPFIKIINYSKHTV
ncbi:single-stranded-DNA-specific exonuclease RecJ [Candidatus Uhrbacteria bacterium]|nr:single-stranded-DNA-specific exonuclease RecJ [Candidatus Uhrbacteria bacterium]